MKLATIEIATLAAVMGDDGVRLCSRLNIASPEEADRSTGLSVLYARGLVAEGDDGLEVDPEAATAISVAAAAERVIRFTTTSESAFGSTQLHWADTAAVTVSPLGFGTFQFEFVDTTAGLDAVVTTVANAVEVDGAFILTDVDSDVSAAIRNHGGVRSVLAAGAEEFETTDDELDWSAVLDDLVAT